MKYLIKASYWIIGNVILYPVATVEMWLNRLYQAIDDSIYDKLDTLIENIEDSEEAREG